MQNAKVYECKICVKIYSSKSSLSNHKKRFHSVIKKEEEKVNHDQHNINMDINISSSAAIPELEKKEDPKFFKCRRCDKRYSFIQSRWRHENVCSKISDVEKIKEENLRQKEEIIKLQKKLLSSKRLDTKTFKSLNKLLMERSMVNSNNTINNNNTTNNIINNYQIVALGNEDLLNVLTMQQKQQILNCRLNSLEKLVEITHCGEMNKFNNIIVTNLKDNYAYRYDAAKGYFVAVPKNSLLDNLVMLRVTDIEAIYDELKAANKIDAKTKMIIQNFLDKMENEDTPVFENDTKYENYKSFKIDNIKILLYNNQDKVTKNIALLISDKDVVVENMT